MTPERIARIRQKLAEARAKGASDTTTVDIMVLTIGELEALVDCAERYDARTAELLKNCARWEQAYRDTKDALKAMTEFGKHTANKLAEALGAST